MHLVQPVSLQMSKPSPRQRKCLRSHLESRVELGEDLEPHLQLQGFCLCCFVLPGHLVVVLLLQSILQYDAGWFTFLIPCNCRSFFLVKMLLCSSMPSSFWFGFVVYCTHHYTIHNINMAWAGEAVESMCCIP